MRLAKNALLVLPGRTSALGDGVIPCRAPLTQGGGEEPYHSLIATYAGTKYLAYISNAFGFGGAIAIQLTSKPGGHSFSGMLPVCNSTWTCTNGQARSYVMSVSGELKTTPAPDELSFTYTIDLFCGNALTCSEKATFSGKRWSGPDSGADNSTEGDFYGKYVWTVTCCPKRHTL